MISTAGVAITVGAVNDAPVAIADSYTTSEDTSLNAVTGILSNDFDVDGDALTIVQVINEDSPLSVSLPGVLANDSDIDGNLLSVVRVAGPAHVTLTLNVNGSFLYAPAANYNGTDSFTYRASDGLLTSNLATVTITIAAVNDVPSASNDSYTTDQDVVLNIAPRRVLLNDSDADGDILSAAVATTPAHGTLVLNANGSFSYTPAPGYSGSDSFTYRASDVLSSSAAATVTLTIVPVLPRAKYL